MFPRDDPSVRNVPISRVFSITVIISVLAMLNAATKMINASIMTVAIFSNSNAANNGACVSNHVVVIGICILSNAGGSVIFCATSGASSASSSRTKITLACPGFSYISCAVSI